MSKLTEYKFSFSGATFLSKCFYGTFCKRKPELAKIVISNRKAKKICRKCYKRLPLNANVCRACKNSDLRTKKENKPYAHFLFDKKTKNDLIEKRNVK